MESRTDKSIKNIYISLGMYIFQLLFSIINRTIFIKLLGSEYLGISGLFSNILAFLTLVESGIGNAMVFALYKPLKEKDIEKIKSIMKLYDKLYLIVSSAVLIIGISLTPFLNVFIKDMPKDIPLLRIYYVLYVLNCAISYLFSYRRTILICDQKLYISNLVRTISFTLLAVIQAIVLLITHDFLFYLIVMIFMTVFENLLVSYIATKKYPYLKEKKVKTLDTCTKTEIKKNVGAIFIQKVGNAVIDSTDNIILSKFVGIVAVGIYSNYVMIINVATRLMDTIFSSLSASVGNLLVDEKSNHSKWVFDRMMFICSIMHGGLAVGMYCMLNPLIRNWLGKKYEFEMLVVFIICLNFYLRGVRRPINIYKEAGGVFWKDRYRTIIEAITNLVVSIPFTLKYGIFGTLLGTTISMMSFSFWYEAYLVYKNVFKMKFIDYTKQQFYYLVVVLLVGGITFSIIDFIPYGNWGQFILRGVMCCLVLCALGVVVFFKNPNVGYFYDLLKGKLLKRKVK